MYTFHEKKGVHVGVHVFNKNAQWIRLKICAVLSDFM